MMRRICIALLTLLLTIGAIALPSLLLSHCAATPHQVASGAVSTAGAITASLHRDHQRIYREATDRLREDLRQRGGTLAEYDAAVVPIDAEFRRRSQSIAALSASLYAAASIIDAARAGASFEQYAAAAAAVIVSLDEVVGAIGAGAILPPVAIPPEVDAVRGTLRTLVGGA